MFPSKFGGHPVLHGYNYNMWRRQQEELLREAEHERLIHAAMRQQRRHNRARLAGRLGNRLIGLGQKLGRFGALRHVQPTPSPSPHH